MVCVTHSDKHTAITTSALHLTETNARHPTLP